MKIKFLAFASLLSLMACKKSYTCICTSSYTFFDQNTNSFYTVVNKGNDAPYSEKMTEKQAKAACKNEEASIQSDYINGVTAGGHPFINGEGVTTSCGLK